MFDLSKPKLVEPSKEREDEERRMGELREEIIRILNGEVSPEERARRDEYINTLAGLNRENFLTISEAGKLVNKGIARSLDFIAVRTSVLRSFLSLVENMFLTQKR